MAGDSWRSTYKISYSKTYYYTWQSITVLLQVSMFQQPDQKLCAPLPSYWLQYNDAPEEDSRAYTPPFTNHTLPAAFNPQDIYPQDIHPPFCSPPDNHHVGLLPPGEITSPPLQPSHLHTCLSQSHRPVFVWGGGDEMS